MAKVKVATSRVLAIKTPEDLAGLSAYLDECQRQQEAEAVEPPVVSLASRTDKLAEQDGLLFRQLAELDQVVARQERRLGQLVGTHNQLVKAHDVLVVNHNQLVADHNSLLADFGILAQRLMALEGQRGQQGAWFEKWQRQKPGRN